LAERATRWLVRHGPKPLDVASTVAANASGAARLARLLPSLLSSADRAAADTRASGWVDAGGGKDLSARVAALDGLAPALDVLHVAGGTPVQDAAGFDTGVGALVTGLGEPGEDVLDDVAAVYFALGEALELDWLRDRIAALPRDDRWQALARSALGDDYTQERAALTAEILRAGGLERWMARHRASVERFHLVIDDIRAGATPDLATLSVAMREARALSQASIAP
jgi:glutamate dehydrogenase